MREDFVVVFLYAFLMSFIYALIATPVFCYLRKVFYVPFARKKMLEKAIAEGHVVQARLVKEHNIADGKEYLHTSGKWYVMYQYQYAGKQYKYRATCYGNPSEEITLYFEKNPKQACAYLELGYMESNWKKYYIRLVAVIFVVLLIWGVFGDAVKM